MLHRAPAPREEVNASESEPHAPKVSIGLAVYNGERYLREAIESLIGQTFSDFEIIISDNASTDATASICEEFATRDCRVRYYRNARNIGGSNNENLTFRIARGQYFRWAAHDDRIAPTFLERCVDVLDNNPDVSLCHTGIVIIDGDGETIEQISRNHGSSPSPWTRFRKVAMAKDYCEETYGLIRASALARTRMQLNYTASDRTLMCELALYGRFHEIPEFLFFKRLHHGNEYVDWRTRMAWFDPSYTGRIFLPFWTQFFDYLVTIRRSQTPLGIQARCASVILGPWLLSHAKNLAKDLAMALYMGVHSRSWRERRYAHSSNWI